MDPFKSRDVIDIGSRKITIYRINRLKELGIADISRLPYSIKVLLEAIYFDLVKIPSEIPDSHKPRCVRVPFP